MAKKRAAERDLKIPLPTDLGLRAACLADCETFLTTCFADVFFEAFTADRRDMMESIIRAAKFGGDQAIAGSRGEGKTKLAIYSALYLAITGLSRFPIVIGKNQRKAQSELRTVKENLQQSELLRKLFPEICVPFHAVGGWSSRGRLQTVGGELTNIELAAEHLIFPKISDSCLPATWPDCGNVAGGQIFASLGIDGGIRGTNYRDQRPSIAIIDDIEDREAADSDVLIEKNEEIIEKDIGGLAASAERIARVFLCTIQNRKCVAFKYTDPKTKPSFKGKRYRKMIRPPERMDLVQSYIEMRTNRDAIKDPDGREAHRFWLANRDEIERGCEISNPASYSKKIHEDGEPLECSAIQSYYNKVADFGEKFVATEIDNNPPETVGPQGSGITWEIVSSRLSGLSRGQVPANATHITAGIDLGKYHCHWTIAAWWRGAGGVVIDYGVAEVKGTEGLDDEASEPKIFAALLQWRDELLGRKFVDAAGAERSVDAVFVDSSAYTDAAYEFVRQVGGKPFFAIKGVSPYHSRTEQTKTIIPGNHLHASYQTAQKVWLYNLDADYWKKFVHERFLTPTFDESNMLRRGSLSLFDHPAGKKHLSYAKHIVAEELLEDFKEGKGVKVYWHQTSPNNHWLDATYMAAAAAGASGIYLLSSDEGALNGEKVTPRAVDADAPKPQQRQQTRRQHGQPKRREGGWIQSLRRR